VSAKTTGIPAGHSAIRRRSGWFGGALADWDLLVLLALILVDVRVLQGSSVASFTLYELFAWGYCTPFVIGHALESRRFLPAAGARFVYPLALYLSWILLASMCALASRQHSEVLQEAKNIMPSLPVVCFLLIRLRQPETVARLANFYVLYCIADGLLALVQLKYGGPYFRSPIENNAYKLDFTGERVSNLVLGFSGTPNELGVAVLPGAMFSAIKLVHEFRVDRRPRLLTVMCCVLTGVALTLSLSRGALIWFAFGFAFMVGPTRHSRSVLLKLVLVAGLIALVVGYGLHAAAASVDAGSDTVEARVLLWKTSLAAMINDPYVALLGDGTAYVRTWSWQTVGWEFPDAHNGWLDQALFFGVPALLLYLPVWQRFFAITDTGVSRGAAPPRTQVLLDGIRASILSFMGLYFFEPVAHAVFPVSQLFLLMSCGVGLASFHDDHRCG
jgi:hypothetical protein